MSAQTHADLDAAIQAHARDEFPGVEIVVDWVLVSGTAGDGPGLGVTQSRDDMPGYVYTGLLAEASAMDPD